MTGIEIILIFAFVMKTVWFLIYVTKTNVELELLSNRISALADDSRRKIDSVELIANNAKGIASNALSSAQKADSKINKMSLQILMEKDMGKIITTEKDA